MSEDQNNPWIKVEGSLGSVVRWNEKATDENQEEKTKYFGTIISGVYTGKGENIGQNSATLYEIKTKEFGIVSIWDTTVLKQRMQEIPLGSEVRIECLGEKKSATGGKSYLNFSVQYRKPPMVEAGVSIDDIPFA